MVLRTILCTPEEENALSRSGGRRGATLGDISLAETSDRVKRRTAPMRQAMLHNGSRDVTIRYRQGAVGAASQSFGPLQDSSNWGGSDWPIAGRPLSALDAGERPCNVHYRLLLGDNADLWRRGDRFDIGPATIHGEFENQTDSTKSIISSG